jgi:arginine utilization protein RocB
MRPEVTERIRQMALDFTAQLSVVETPGEIEMAQKIYDTIADIDYYKKHP